MLMAELSRSSGVPVATIKYYLREGLLPPGTATSATRAEYGEAHLRRLRLIRALVEIGEIPVAAIGHILAVVDDEVASLHVMLGAVQYAPAPRLPGRGRPRLAGGQPRSGRADHRAGLDRRGERARPDPADRDAGRAAPHRIGPARTQPARLRRGDGGAGCRRGRQPWPRRPGR